MVQWVRALCKLIDLSSNLYYLSKSLALPQVLVMLALGERDKQIQGHQLDQIGELWVQGEIQPQGKKGETVDKNTQYFALASTCMRRGTHTHTHTPQTHTTTTKLTCILIACE